MLPSWALLLVASTTAVGLGFAARYALSFIAGRFARFHRATFIRNMLIAQQGPSIPVVGALAFMAMVPAVGLQPPAETSFIRLAAMILVAGFAWAAYQFNQLAFERYARRYSITGEEDFTIRRRQTRINLLRRVCTVLIIITAVAIVFTMVPALRAVGVSLFASAGLAGIAVGLAARPVISNLLAGVQIAFSEAIRIGDQVVLEGEWGTIEDITSTYVVVNIWDQRRLILPLSYFLEKPFQNWTRQSSQILGTSLFYVDYSVPVEAMRAELQRILKSSPYWDGRAWALQVTDLKENTMEIRALMSARNAGSAFDLRCEVREKMIDFLRENYAHALPRVRLELEPRRRLSSGWNPHHPTPSQAVQ